MTPKVFARLPAYNPFVGTFHHAPSAGNRGAAYFWSDIVGVDELAERKKFRHNPLTGTFHALPGYYDPLHGLQQFRNESSLDPPSPIRRVVSAPSSPQKQVWPLHRMFSAPTFDDEDNNNEEEVVVKPRRYSFPLIKMEKESVSINQSDNDVPGVELHAVLLDRQVSNSSPVDGASVWNMPNMRNTRGYHTTETMSVASETSSTTSSSDSTHYVLDDDLLVSPLPEIVTNHLGYISTGKGVFRSSFSGSDCHRLSSPSSNPALDDNNEPVSSSEYSQCAPRRPSNPFVARRLSDGDQLRIMAIDRVGPRVLSMESLNSTVEVLEEHYTIEQPKPYFIHEKAVTEQYELIGEDQLGDGSYAVVKRAIRRNNSLKVAIKQIHKRYLRSEQAKKAVEREVELHQRLRDKHIIQLFEVYETDDFLYLVMDIATKGNLKALMMRKRRLCESLAGKIAQQILRAVFYLHEHGVLHCDIKPENVLLTDPPKNLVKPDVGTRTVNPADPFADVRACDFQVKVCDFGLAIKVPDARFYKYTGDVHKVPFTGLTGTPGYIAPELMERQSYGKPVDMWSVGVVIYEMLTGYQPFYPPHACIDTPVDFNDPVWKAVSPCARDLVEKLLNSDPNSRYTVQEALAHSWFETTAFAF